LSSGLGLGVVCGCGGLPKVFTGAVLFFETNLNLAKDI